MPTASQDLNLTWPSPRAARRAQWLSPLRGRLPTFSTHYALAYEGAGPAGATAISGMRRTAPSKPGPSCRRSQQDSLLSRHRSVARSGAAGRQRSGLRAQRTRTRHPAAAAWHQAGAVQTGTNELSSPTRKRSSWNWEGSPTEPRTPRPNHLVDTHTTMGMHEQRAPQLTATGLRIGPDHERDHAAAARNAKIPGCEAMADH